MKSFRYEKRTRLSANASTTYGEKVGREDGVFDKYENGMRDRSFRRKDIKISMSTADGERRPTLDIIDGAGGKGPRISRETRNGGSTCTGELRRKLGSFSFECA